MRTNVYESAVLINAALDDEQIQSVISRIQENITNNGGEIRDVEDWGRKRLAYMVKKSKIGYYVFFRFNAPSTIVSKLDRTFILDEHIIRFLTVRLDKDAVEYLEGRKEASSEKSDTESMPKPAVKENEKENSDDELTDESQDSE